MSTSIRYTAVPVIALVILGMLDASGVSASPGDSSATPSCAFILSKPAVSTLTDGVQAVTATVRATACTGLAQPQSTTVCVSPTGSNGRCSSDAGWNANQAVYPAATAPRGEYTATAVGCYNVAGRPFPICAPLPASATTF